MIMPRLESVPERAKDVAKNVTAEVLTRGEAVLRNRQNFLSNSFQVRIIYNTFSNDTIIPIKFGASKKTGRNQKVSSFKIKG
jgi:hypothetical protein